MKIIKNSARCTACGTEIISIHRHDFNVHYCEVQPKQAYKWDSHNADAKLVPIPGETTWRFAVDGGKDYIRRAGGGFIDTSEYLESPNSTYTSK